MIAKLMNRKKSYERIPEQSNNYAPLSHKKQEVPANYR